MIGMFRSLLLAYHRAIVLKHLSKPLLPVVLCALAAFLVFWGYEHAFWTTYDPTLDGEEHFFNTVGIHVIAKAIHRFHIHSETVTQNLWGPLPYYLCAVGMEVFGEHLSTVRKVLAILSGFWGLILFRIIQTELRRPILALFLALAFIPFSGHVNFMNRGQAGFHTFMLASCSMLLLLRYTQSGKNSLLWWIGGVQGIAFGIKYELSLLGLASVFMTLYVLETVQTLSRFQTETSGVSSSSTLSAVPLPRVVKMVFLLVPLVLSAFLIRFGIYPHLFLLFWLSSAAILFLEVKILFVARKNKFEIPNCLGALSQNALRVLVPWGGVILFWFLHLWHMTDLGIATAYFKEISNVSEVMRRMGLVSPTFSDSQYFWRVHPIEMSQILFWTFLVLTYTWALWRFASQLPFFLQGLLAGLATLVSLACIGSAQIHTFSIYYFLILISIGLWISWLSNWKEMVGAQEPALRLVVYLCFLAIGSLGLLREAGSLDHNLWPMLPPLLGALLACTFPLKPTGRLPIGYAVAFSVLFYFVWVYWGRIESQVLNDRQLAAEMIPVDEELDLAIPRKAALDLREMRAFFQEHLASGDKIYVFSGHHFPYLFSMHNGLTAENLPHYHSASPRHQERLLHALKTENVKFVLFSEGIPSYNSEPIKKFYPALHQYILDHYSDTGRRLAGFLAVYARRSETSTEGMSPLSR